MSRAALTYAGGFGQPRAKAVSAISSANAARSGAHSPRQRASVPARSGRTRSKPADDPSSRIRMPRSPAEYLAKSSSTTVRGAVAGSALTTAPAAAAAGGAFEPLALARSSAVGVAAVTVAGRADAGGAGDTETLARAAESAVPGLGTTTQDRARTIAPRWPLFTRTLNCRGAPVRSE